MCIGMLTTGVSFCVIGLDGSGLDLLPSNVPCDSLKIKTMHFGIHLKIVKMFPTMALAVIPMTSQPTLCCKTGSC